MKYEPLPDFDLDEANEILAHGSEEELLILPLSAGENCSNWKVAQDICLKLVEHESDLVSSNALLGLAYVARNHRKLEKHLVKPALIDGRRRHSEFSGKVEAAIEDINLFMDWGIGTKKIAFNKT